MVEHRGTERNDIASGKLARVVTGPFDIVVNDPRATGGGDGSPCRAFVAQGAVTIKGLDNVNVPLPDFGNFWWDVQAVEIVSGSAIVIY